MRSIHAAMVIGALGVVVNCASLAESAGGANSTDAQNDLREGSTYIAGGDWPAYNKTLDGQRYSPLAQINVKNADRLEEVCRIRVADSGAFQAGLIVVGEVMYATTPTDTIALDAANCRVKWRHRHHRSQNPLFPVNRGVAYASGRLFRGTDDGRLIALDARSGAEVWSDVVGDARAGELLSGAPVAWNGLIIAGTAVGEFGIRGRVMAFDALTGREVWRFHTIPVGKETGAQTWANTRWNEHGGGGTWSSFTIDPTAAEVFVPVGNAVPDFAPADRPGQNLFTNCVVVLDALTGRLKWWYQTKSNDAQDHDLGAAPLLYTDSRHQARVAAAGKDGYLHIIDRAAHKLIVKTAVTTVDEKQKVPSTTWVRMCPGPAGGTEWNGPGFDPQRQLLFVGAVDYCGFFKSNPGSSFTPGSMNNGGQWSPGSEAATGWITAVDAGTGKAKWRYHAEAPVLGGITPTAGGVVLSGDNAGNLLLFNSDSGEILRKLPLGGALAGGIITYQQNGKQFVAVTSGNLARTVWGGTGRPSIVILALPDSETADAVQPHGSSIARGRETFNGMCAVCHGVDGKNIVINGNDLTTVKQRMSVEQLIAWIRNPEPPMPQVFPEPLRESEELEIQDLAAFLHEWPQ